MKQLPRFQAVVFILALTGCSFDATSLRRSGGDAATDTMHVSLDSAGMDPDARADSASTEKSDLVGGALDTGPRQDAIQGPDIPPSLTPDADEAGAETGLAVDAKPEVESAPPADALPLVDGNAPEDAPIGLDIAPPSDTAAQVTIDALSSIVDTAPDAPSPPVIVNLSLGKPSTASSQQLGKEAIFGNDESSTSKFCPANMYFPVWWRVDLGAVFDIARTDLAFEKPDTYYKYKIEISVDGGSWVTMVDQSTNTTRNGALLSDSFTGRARYVRVTISGVSTTSTWGCFLDFQVWGSVPTGSLVPVNLAPSGTAYRWYGNSASGSDTNKTLERRLNDISTEEELNLAGSGSDSWYAWEAAGILFSGATTFGSVVFVSGSAIYSMSGVYEGNFAGNFRIQVSSNGTSWSDLTGWTVTPDYSMDYACANRAFVFSGPTTTAMGVRITGQVRLSGYSSTYAMAREVQVWGMESASTAAGSPIFLEAESLTVTASSIGTYLSNDTCSGSACTYVALNTGGSVGDYMEFTLPNIPAGTYDLRIVYKGGPYRGIGQARFNGMAVGDPFDQYMNATTQQLTWTPGSVTVATAGSQKLRLSVTGRNTNAMGYTLTVDNITLTPR